MVVWGQERKKEETLHKIENLGVSFLMESRCVCVGVWAMVWC